MAKIIVAGAGHGGLVAAVKLANAGFDVTIFEKNEKDDVGLPQSDAFSCDTFDYIDLPASPNFKRGKNILTFIPKDNELQPLTMPPPKEESYIVDRKELVLYLLSLCREAGVKIFYNTSVEDSIVLGNRVVGVVVNGEKHYCDLVIDACGVKSYLRNSLPDYFNINREIMPYDVIYTYRGYFGVNKSAPRPKTSYNIYVRDNGTVGFSWLISEEERNDVLIGRFYKPQNDEILELLRSIQEENPHIDKELIYGGTHSVIPVCQPLSVLVGNGYACVGDSGFMTYPTKGSGISNSMKAGAILSETVINDELGAYDCHSLWDYEKRFFKEIGFDSCQVALCKNILPYMTAEQVNELFSRGLFTTEELAVLAENPIGTLFSQRGYSALKDKLRILRESETLKDIFSSISKWQGLFKLIEATFPSDYDYDVVAKWSKRYNDFFNSIRYKEETDIKEI